MLRISKGQFQKAKRPLQCEFRSWRAEDDVVEITKMSFCAILWTLEIALIEPHAGQTTDTVTCPWAAGQWPHIKQTRTEPFPRYHHPGCRNKSKIHLAIAAANALHCTYNAHQGKERCRRGQDPQSVNCPANADWELVLCRLRLNGDAFYTALLISECGESESRPAPPTGPYPCPLAYAS